MQTTTSNRQAAINSTQPGHQRLLRLTIVQAVLGIVALVFSLPLPAQSEPTTATTIVVLVYNYVGVPHSTLAAAERESNKILGVAGAQADFVECLEQPVAPASKNLCQMGWTAQTPGLRLISSINKFQQVEFAETAIPVLSTIYFEKVARRVHRENADADLSVFLGCVMAHELGHLLLSNPDHSAAGIMQPQWGSPQMRQALTGNLLFTRQQATRIQAKARLLASLRSAAGPAFPAAMP
jgi:hypothetical protein